MQAGDRYSLLMLEKLDAGYRFAEEKDLGVAAPDGLDAVPAHNVLHKTVRPWTVDGLSIDVLVFDDIGLFACINYRDGVKERTLALISELNLPDLRYLEVPFNVVKRRQSGLPDFDARRKK
jgi:hypothetical protein